MRGKGEKIEGHQAILLGAAAFGLEPIVVIGGLYAKLPVRSAHRNARYFH
jgi:hypothetical protein